MVRVVYLAASQPGPRGLLKGNLGFNYYYRTTVVYTTTTRSLHDYNIPGSFSK